LEGSGDMHRQDPLEHLPHPEHRESYLDLAARLESSSAGLTNRLLAHHGLTSPQASMLLALHRHGPELALPELASITDFPLGAVTSIMDRLLVRGLVVRSGHPSHGQWVVAALTPDGFEITEAVETARHALLERLLGGLADDELTMLARLVDRLEDEVTRELLPSPSPAIEPEPFPVPMLRLIRGERD
jgi:DNA-binding MarR family transcriptional regulator